MRSIFGDHRKRTSSLLSMKQARTIVEALEPIKTRGALETVRRLVQRINEIMINAVKTGVIDADPALGVGIIVEKPKKQKIPTLHLSNCQN